MRDGPQDSSKVYVVDTSVLVAAPDALSRLTVGNTVVIPFPVLQELDRCRVDTNGVGYTAWTWYPCGCTGDNVLIQDYSGTPTETYGSGFKAHLLTVHP